MPRHTLGVDPERHPVPFDATAHTMSDDDAVALVCFLAQYARCWVPNAEGQQDGGEYGRNLRAGEIVGDVIDSLPRGAVPAWARIECERAFGRDALTSPSAMLDPPPEGWDGSQPLT